MSNDTYIKYGRAVVNWKLSNFNRELLNRAVAPRLPPLYSPEFKIYLNYEATKWKFIAHRNKTELGIYLRKVEENRQQDNYIVKYDVQIKDQVNDVLVKRSHGKVEIQWFEHKLSKIINFKECLRPRSYRIIYNASIEVVVYLEVIKKNQSLATLFNSTLSSHYEKMFNNENFSDFIITTSDNRNIYVHKNILSMRSPVFDAMISSSMKEGNEKKVKIDDIQGKSVMELIRFIYAGKVNEIDSIANELLYAANKYDIQDLKPLCVESLALNMTSDNVLETFALAELHQENYLKMFCMDFIKYKYDEVKIMPEWKELNNEALKEILDYMMSPRSGKKTESSIITTISHGAPSTNTAVPTSQTN